MADAEPEFQKVTDESNKYAGPVSTARPAASSWETKSTRVGERALLYFRAFERGAVGRSTIE